MTVVISTGRVGVVSIKPSRAKWRNQNALYLWHVVVNIGARSKNVIRMKASRVLLMLIVLMVRAITAQCAEVAPPHEFATLEPPVAAAILPGGSPTNALEAATLSLRKSGFEVAKKYDREMMVEFRKYGVDGKQDYDRVVIWFSRDVVDPSLLKAYVLFARYIEIYGTGGKRAHLVLEQDEEDVITRYWKPSLIKALEKSRG